MNLLKFTSRSSTLILYIFIFSWGFFACSNIPDERREYGWFDFVIPDLDSTQNAVDMSFLNPDPAGASGFISVKDGHFVDGVGKRIRFFGDNLTFSDAFPDKKTATSIAAHLKKLGMNVIRFHHMDNQSAPRGIWNQDKTDLDPGQLDKLDWLIYQLKLHGVYSNLNTHVSFTYPGVDEKPGNFHFGKGIDQFYHPYIEMQKAYAKKLLTHLNPYTGNTYANEPAVAFVEINNENSLLSNWKLLPELNKEHKAALIAQWKTWLRSKRGYPNSADLMKIITGYDNQDNLHKEMMWGFLSDTEQAYAKEMMDYYKNDLKIHAMVCESQASYSGLEGVYRESQVSDFIDMHAYWEHPRFPGSSWSRTDWLIRNSSMVSDKKGGTVLNFGLHRVAGMPLTISEYDHPAPTFFCAEMYPMLNSIAAFQDFDGIYHFTFGGPYNKGKINGFFTSAGHPLKQVFIPVGAALFRMGEVQPGKTPVQLNLPPESITEELVKFGSELKLHHSNMRSVWEEAGANESLIVLHPMSVTVQPGDLTLNQTVASPSGPWISDTGEITWDNTDSLNAVFKINAPAARAAVGYIGGRVIELGNVIIAMDSTPSNWATITLNSLDSKPLESAGSILLVAAGKVLNTDMNWNADSTTVGDQWGRTPTRAEGIPAKIIFRDMDKLRVHVLDSAGNETTNVPVEYGVHNQELNIGAQYKTLWYLLRR